MEKWILMSLIQENNELLSLPELMNIDEVGKLFRPAVCHIYRIIREQFPSSSSKLLSLNDIEINHYCNVCEALLDCYCIIYHDSTYVESLFGLKRTSEVDSLSLSSFQKLVSISFMICQRFYYKPCIENTSFPLINTTNITGIIHQLTQSRFPLVVSIGSFINKIPSSLIRELVRYGWTAEKLLVFVYRFMYAFGKTKYHHPLFAIAHMKLIKQRFSLSFMKSSTNQLDSSQTSSQTMLSVFLYLLYFVRLGDWFYSQDFQSNHIDNWKQTINSNSHISSGLPPAPTLPSHISNQLTPNVCPLCHKKHVKPTATKSGIVYCFDCIQSYLNQHQKCPLTHIPMKEIDLIILRIESEN